jgi:hypothetical protein
VAAVFGFANGVEERSTPAIRTLGKSPVQSVDIVGSTATDVTDEPRDKLQSIM